jgi:hypothetical protein
MFLVTIANQTFMTTIDSPTFSDVSGIKSLLLPQETLFQVCWKKKYTPSTFKWTPMHRWLDSDPQFDLISCSSY